MTVDTIQPDLQSIPTPALTIDAAVVRDNIGRLSEYARRAGVGVRPHTKTHKLRHIARMQLEAGAIGLTAAKVSEAAAISDSGEDVLLAYPPIGRHRAEQLAELAKDRTVRAAVDSEAAVEMMADAALQTGATVGLLVDVNVGMDRTGVPTPADALRLAQAIDRSKGLRVDGIMIYPGHIYDPPTKQMTAIGAVNAIVEETLELWQRAGLEASIVSGGSTPTAYQSHLMPRVTEIRAGAYVFNDMNTVRCSYCAIENCAARVVATVVSDAISGQVVIDAGSKSLTRDPSSDPNAGFGYVVEFPEARISKLSEEHGQIDVSACSTRPRIGERLTVIPNHVCPCVNLHDSVWWIEANEAPREVRVDARGKVQ
jgi:D-serine deaminase-like pyridoxal phosphate-dependent protein